jgi:hypothetical protein
MKFISSCGPIGPEDIASLTGSQLLIVHNELRSANGDSVTKRFADSKSGRERTTRAYELWRSRQPQRATPISPTMSAVRAETKLPPATSRGLSSAASSRNKSSARVGDKTELMRLPARRDIRTHKPNTSRGKIIALGCRKEGITSAEIQRMTGWDLQQIRSCLRQINQHTGHGIEERSPEHFYISGEPRKRKSLSWAPKSEIREHKKGTKRAKAIQMLLRSEGASFEDIKAACSWNDVQAYEGIKLLHGYLGYGIEEKDGVIRAYTKEKQK